LSDFNKEIELYKSVPKNRKIIYFSTISVCDPHDKRPYVKHKREMEALIKENDHLIFRLTQVVGASGNKNNIINYFVDRIRKKEKITIQENAKRSIIDIEDVKKVVAENISLKNESINFAGYEVLYVKDLIEIIFKCLNSRTELIFKYGYSNYIPENEIKIQGYTEKTLNKYLNGHK
jgi:nucleoside-diphosphate-sugar epimerase